MLSESNKKTLIKLIKESSQEEIIWICGYISGLLCPDSVEYSFDFIKKKELEKNITLVYGTETGNSRNLAFDIYQKLKLKGLNISSVDLNLYPLQNLEKEDYLFIIISTYGEGEPPSSAKNFFDFIHKKGVLLKKLKYGVLALGDRSYPFFCKAGVDVDKRLHDMGGVRIISLHKCDVDYEEEANKWYLKILNFFQKGEFEKKNERTIIYGKISNNISLSNKKKGSNKEIRHIEIFVQNDIKYFPGDSVGIFPENSSEEVDSIMEFLLENEDIRYELKEEKYKQKILNLFKKKFNIFCLSDNFLKKYFSLSERKDIFINRNHDNNNKWRLIDLLKEFPFKKEFSLKNLMEIMEPIKPRLYSISSSPKVHHNEIHITVSRHSFQLNGKNVFGHCSDFLSKLKKGDRLYFFIHKNRFFRLPKNYDKDIILIGPGTGIAPFRSFLYEREYIGGKGKNWLFFGGQHIDTDFLYQKEIQNWEKKRIIHCVSLSFSRDQNKKIYVQDKIWENRKEFFSWIKNGAYVYICGKKNPMSIDVEKMIYNVIDKVGGYDPVFFIKKMKKEGRYLKDVY
ncbi:diflavin oxidoreductase [Blattabacterium cuenoti]|uniref:diflavin oxidoreductase n=1 Tax=Blattabacterium cuenoti TaxID=1653831 RepID=UPI00163BC133|nr:flavodoxin domain-containing protein [Blattabacterium cuenoti]